MTAVSLSLSYLAIPAGLVAPHAHGERLGMVSTSHQPPGANSTGQLIPPVQVCSAYEQLVLKLSLLSLLCL